MSEDVQKVRILVIEDNESVLSMIEMFFAKEGIRGEYVTDGLRGFESALRDEWDCIIIDWMLPNMDGITVCRKLREVNQSVPIIMLTAKDAESDQVRGLEMGADDYVTKPFSPLALMARIKAVIRRARSQVDEQTDTEVMQTTYFKVNKKTREVYLKGQLVSNLTPKEFDLLYHFIQHPKQVFSRDQLLDSVWGYEFYGDDRTVDVHIKRLRTKVGNDKENYFQTVWGVGYKFDEADVHRETTEKDNQDAD